MVNSFDFQNKNQGLIYLVALVIYNLVGAIGAVVVELLGAQGIVSTVIFSLFPPIAFILTGLIFKPQTRIVYLSVKQKLCYKSLIFSILISIGMLFAFGYINLVFGEFLASIGIRSSSSSIVINGFSDYILLVFFVGVLPAIFEEFFFRGLLLTANKSISSLFAIVISALAFSLYHGSVSMLIYQFIYGLVLGYVFIKTSNLLYGIIIHFLNNFIVLSFEYFNLVLIDIWYLIVMGGVITLIGLYGIYKTHKKLDKTKGKSSLYFFIPYGVIALIFSIFTVILGVIL